MANLNVQQLNKAVAAMSDIIANQALAISTLQGVTSSIGSDLNDLNTACSVAIPIPYTNPSSLDARVTALETP